jgi:hypothetical protein
MTRAASSAGTTSQLDAVIPAEIIHDRFYRWIARIAASPGVRAILEIGSASGTGSTQAFVDGALRNSVRPTLYCLEISRPRYAALCGRYADRDFVHCYNMSSVPAESFPTAADIDAFRRRVWTRFRFIPRRTVVGWLEQDLEYIHRHRLSAHGIRLIRRAAGIDVFDAVLIDGSEFTGRAELAEVYGARFLLLDDIGTYKNHDNYHSLRKDRAYRLVAHGRWLRNGFAVFERCAASTIGWPA